MQTYLVMRRGAWKSHEELEDANALSARVADDEMADQLKWIRSYVVDEEDGTLGMVCIYQADDEDILLEHAQRTELPADEVIPVADTLIVRDDP